MQLIVDDRVVPRTNVADLVAHVLYPHDERMKDPRGFTVFVQGLKDIGLESEWVENEIAKSVLESVEDDTGETSEDADSDDVSEDEDGSENEQDESENEDDESEIGDHESEIGDDESENGDDESEMDS